MASPFLEIPSSQWVDSNELAFAIRDRFPVSPGHTLIVPKRLVATWFEASRQEQVAILELIDEVRAHLEREPRRPDGYNVGFNVDAAGGQTVAHLHVHVIPRFAGDMEDPRGGVRLGMRTDQSNKVAGLALERLIAQSWPRHGGYTAVAVGSR